MRIVHSQRAWFYGKRSRRTRPSFTLVELLIVTVIIGILSSTVLYAMYGVIEDARELRTRAQIMKLHQLVQSRWDEFRSRKIPVLIPPNVAPLVRSRVRLLAIRELMRMELPDRITDLTWSPTPLTPAIISGLPAFPAGSEPAISPPSLWRSYRRRALNVRGIPSRLSWPSEGPTVASVLSSGTWSAANQGAECLYLIIASIEDGDSSAIEFFKKSEIGDTDGDGQLEILDGWGRPIQFLRWAPGYATRSGPDGFWGIANTDDDSNSVTDDQFEIGAWNSDDDSELQSRDVLTSPDQFDPLRVDPRWRLDTQPDPFALFPLIFSAGRDALYGIATENPNTTFAYSRTSFAGTSFPNDPYAFVDPSNQIQIGRPIDDDGDGLMNHEDNVTNHLLEAE